MAGPEPTPVPRLTAARGSPRRAGTDRPGCRGAPLRCRSPSAPQGSRQGTTRLIHTPADRCRPVHPAAAAVVVVPAWCDEARCGGPNKGRNYGLRRPARSQDLGCSRRSASVVVRGGLRSTAPDGGETSVSCTSHQAWSATRHHHHRRHHSLSAASQRPPPPRRRPHPTDRRSNSRAGHGSMPAYGGRRTTEAGGPCAVRSLLACPVNPSTLPPSVARPRRGHVECLHAVYIVHPRRQPGR